jgi:hypothetical protein
MAGVLAVGDTSSPQAVSQRVTLPTLDWRRDSYRSSDSGRAERFSPGSSGAAPAARTSVPSISVTTGSSTPSTTTVSTTGVLGGFTALTLFRAFFAPGLSLALAGRFLGTALAILRFAGLFRADLGGLRAVRRVTDFPFRFRTAGRFFR